MGRSRPLPILMYHNVAHPPPGVELPGLYVPPAAFEAQMRWMARVGLRGVSMSGGLRALAGEANARVVVITFDDGYADNVEQALPVLLRHGFTATCFVASGALGSFNVWDAERLRVRKPMMTRAQLARWREAGMEVGAHTRTHPQLVGLGAAELEREVAGSREELEALTGGAVEHFCYPYGAFDPAAVEAVRRAGFVSATTVRRARARRTDDPFRLPRVVVRGEDPIPRFLLKLLTPYEDYRGGREERRRRPA